MRWLLLILLAPSLALAAGPRVISGSGTISTGPRIMGEASFAFELDALEQAETSRGGWSVTTTRASECYTEAGAQQPANRACIGRWGLNCYGPVTNYAVNSTVLQDWQTQGDVTITTPAAGEARLTFVTASAGASRGMYAPLAKAISTTALEEWTISFEVRPSAGVSLLRIDSLSAAGTFCDTAALTVGAWQRIHCTRLAGSTSLRPLLYGTAAAGAYVDVRQWQAIKSPTPGPRHDCGPTPCSRQGDVHTVPTTGFPVAAGEIRLQYVPLAVPGVLNAYLLDTRSPGIALLLSGSTLRALSSAGGNVVSAPLTWVACDPLSASCVPYDIRLVWGGGAATLYRDGVQVATGALTSPASFNAVARIGIGSSGTEPALGSIRLIRVSQ